MSHTAAWPNEDFSIAMVFIHPDCKGCQVWNVIDSLKKSPRQLCRRGLTYELLFTYYLSSAMLLPLYFKAACAAARRAIGTRKGEQDT